MSTATVADDWWHGLPPDRRIQIWQWVAGKEAAPHQEVEGQFALPLHPHRR